MHMIFITDLYSTLFGQIQSHPIECNFHLIKFTVDKFKEEPHNYENPLKTLINSKK